MFKNVFKVGAVELVTTIDPSHEKFLELFNGIIEVKNLHSFIEEQPVYPAWRGDIQKMEFVRAIHGTLAIEDSGITVQEIENIIDKGLSAEQLTTEREKEASNALKAYEFIQDWLQDNPDSKITEPVIKQLNTIITRDLVYHPYTPGQYRSHIVSFGVPRRKSELKTLSDIQLAMTKLVEFINAKDEQGAIQLSNFPITKALTAHYLISLIHPFSDGNGRGARALEALILHSYGKFSSYCFPITAKFYYSNRTKYFELLRHADNTGDIVPFLLFAINGLRTHLKEIKKNILEKITHSLIIDYIYQLRRRKVILKRQATMVEILFKLGKLSTDDFWYSPSIRGLYNNLSESTRRRDILNLLEQNLIIVGEEKTPEGKKKMMISANWDVLKNLTLRLDRVPHRP